MSDHSECYELLIVKYLSGNASRQECEKLLYWLKQDQSNQELYIRTKTAWQDAGSAQIKVSREEEWQRLMRKIYGIRRLQSRKVWVRVSQIAAVFLLAFTLGWLLKSQYSPKPKRTWMTVQVPTGQMTRLSLTDDSKVWINSESTLRYPSDFGKESRQVELSGEAYFEVSHHQDLPFVVKTKYMDVQVLGTRFNVSAYEEDAQVRTILVEGKVSMKMPESNTDGIILEEGEMARLNTMNHTITIQKRPAVQQSDMGWIEGRYEFFNEPLREILKRASRWYDVDFEVKERKLQNMRFTGVMKKEYPVEQLLQLVQKTAGVSIQKTEDQIIINLK